MEKQNNIKALAFTSDERFDRMANWAKNSFEYTNPDIEFVILDMHNKKYENYNFHKWHNETKDHELRKHNPYGFLKYLAALEFMERENVDSLILLGADVITVGSFSKALNETNYDILTSLDIGNSGLMPLNPDVQVIFGKRFLTDCKNFFLDQMKKYTETKYTIETYSEMSVLNYICNTNKVRHIPLHNVYNSTAECFNKNVRSNIHSFFNNNDQKIKTTNGEHDIITIHIQNGLGTCNTVDDVDEKLSTSMNEYSIFHDDSVKQFIEKITKDKIWA